MQYLRAWYGQIPFARIKAHLRRTDAEIHLQAESMGMRVKPCDRPSEDLQVAVESPRKPLLCTPASGAIRQAIAELPRRRAASAGGQPWTDQEDAKLVELVNAGFTQDEVAEHLDRPVAGVRNRMSGKRVHPPVGARNNAMGRALYKARYYLKRNDHITALHVIEQSIKEARP